MCLNCDGDSTKCNTCQVGYYNNGGICYKCQLSCQSCVSSTLCTACNAGNYLLSTGRCKSLPSNCVQVSSTTGSCTKCNYGYQIEEGICVPCSTDLFNVHFYWYLDAAMLKILSKLLCSNEVVGNIWNIEVDFSYFNVNFRLEYRIFMNTTII